MVIVIEILKWIVVLLISALIDVPLFRVGARMLSLRRLSFGATYLLALIVSGSLIVSSIVVSPILPSLSNGIQLLVSVALSLFVSGWVVGYFFTTEDRNSIGFAKGSMLVLIVNLLFAVVVVLLAVILVGFFNVKP